MICIKYNELLDNKIKQIIAEYLTTYGRVLRSKGFKGRCEDHTCLIDYIYACTKALDSEEFEYSLKTRLYWLLNHIQDFDDPRVRCKQCGKPITNWNVASLAVGYKSTCCHECERKYAQAQNVRHLQEKFGEDVTNVFLLSSVKAKIEEKKDETHAKRQSY